jgi:hypothetical protein
MIGMCYARTQAQASQRLSLSAAHNHVPLYTICNPLLLCALTQKPLFCCCAKPHLQEAPRKRKTLEQKRAVVLDKDEKKAATLLQQLNAIRLADRAVC